MIGYCYSPPIRFQQPLCFIWMHQLQPRLSCVARPGGVIAMAWSAVLRYLDGAELGQPQVQELSDGQLQVGIRWMGENIHLSGLDAARFLFV